MSGIRLRPGVHYAPLKAGVYVSGARATFVMAGPAVLFRVVDTCLPLLEDGTDIEELVAAMGTEAARPLVSHVVTTFDSRGLVLHLDRLSVPEPEPGERERFPETLAYLETHRDDPYADFRRIRAARVLVAGPAEALGPAIRGLRRAGVGHIVVATPEREPLAALAARHPDVVVKAWSEGAALPVPEGDGQLQAALIFTEDGFPAEAVAALPASCIAVPVRLGKDLAIVGPGMGPGASSAPPEELWSRSITWCHRDGGDLLVRPSGDLLAGALAGQVAFDALVGLNPGQVHLVHGPDLSADSMAPAVTPGPAWESPTELTPAASEAATDDEWLATLSAPWSGLFRITVPGDLPQMPLSLTLAEGRSRWFDGRAVGFGPDQEASTREAALAALRGHCHGLCGHHPGAAAAGVSETEWLLDGALRLMARGAGEERPVEWLAVDDIEARRLWRALEEYQLVPVRLTSRHFPDFGWVLVSVHDRRRDVLIGQGWGPAREGGAVAALSAALATVQAGGGDESSSAAAGFVGHLHRRHSESLTSAVETWLSATGQRLRGRRLATDPVAGPLGAWCGTVWLDD